MRSLMIGLMVVGLTGCTFGIATCADGQQCPPGSQCDETTKFCVAPDASVGGGTGGGTTTGGGGGATGGGMTGGGTGGGVDQCATTTCDPGYLCESGNCVLKVTGVQILTAAGATYGPSAPMALSARLTTAGGIVSPATLRVDATAFPSLTRLQESGGMYAAAALAPTGASGQTTVTVHADFADAGFSSSIQVNVDTQAPTIAFSVVPPPPRSSSGDFIDQDIGGAGAFKRDEAAELQVASSEAVALSATDFTGVPMAALSATACSTACALAVCSCFKVELSVLDMDAFRKTFGVSLLARSDMYGNVSAAVPPVSIPVTRFRWSRSVEVNSLGAPNAIHAPTVAASGVVYVGVEQTSSVGAVWGVSPTGSVVSSFDGGAITASPVAGDSVYVAFKNAAEGGIRAVGVGAVCAGAGRLFNSSMALTDMDLADGGVERVVGVSQNGWLVGVRSAAAGNHCVEIGVPSVSGANRYSVVAEDGIAFLATTASATLTRVPWSAATPSWATATSTNQHNLFTDALVRLGTTIGGGGGGGLTVGGVYAVTDDSFATTTPAKFTLSGGSSVATGPAVGGSISSPVFVYGNGSTIVSVPHVAGVGVNAGSFGVQASQDLSGAELVGTPAIGSDGTIYVVDTNGKITAMTSALVPLWSDDVAGSVDSSLALDAARNGTQRVCSRPGSLYVASTGDGRLYSIVVDSKGLSGTAPWPTYQHDSARTGNQTRSLTDWACP